MVVAETCFHTAVHSTSSYPIKDTPTRLRRRYRSIDDSRGAGRFAPRPSAGCSPHATTARSISIFAKETGAPRDVVASNRIQWVKSYEVRGGFQLGQTMWWL